MDEGVNMNEKYKPIEIYNIKVDENINNNCDKENYKDPDVNFIIKRKPKIFLENIKEEEVEIKLSTDGLCGIKKIREFSNDKIIADYTLLRKGKFGVLMWPVQSLSINQKRGFKSVFDDRLDLTLMDIQDFYDCVKGKKLSVGTINDIKKRCVMSDVFLNEPTLMWLCSFKDFDEFIRERNLSVFVKLENDGKYYAESWIGDTKEKREKFKEEYYKQLLERTKNWNSSENGEVLIK